MFVALLLVSYLNRIKSEESKKSKKCNNMNINKQSHRLTKINLLKWTCTLISNYTSIWRDNITLFLFCRTGNKSLLKKCNLSRELFPITLEIIRFLCQAMYKLDDSSLDISLSTTNFSIINSFNTSNYKKKLENLTIA